MDLDELIESLEDLIERRDTDRALDPGKNNVRCEGCDGCTDCRFCVACSQCEDCTYCVECVECVGTTQSTRSVGCRKSSHLIDSRECHESRYLTLCVECRDCTHCLACTGLQGEEFFVLNEKRSRKEYFELLERVKAQLEERSAAGWRPAPIGLESEEDIDEPTDEPTDVFERDEDVEPEPTSDSDIWDDAPSSSSRLRRGARPQRGPANTDDSSASSGEPPAARSSASLRSGRRPERGERPEPSSRPQRNAEPERDDVASEQSEQSESTDKSGLRRGRRPQR